MKRGILMEEEIGPIQGEVAIDFIGPNLMEPFHSIFPGAVHQYGGSEDIGFQEYLGALDGTVHMGFRGEVNNDIGPFLLEDILHLLPIADIFLIEDVVGVLQLLIDGMGVRGVGACIDVDDLPFFPLLQKELAEAVADEPGSAGDEDGFVHSWIPPIGIRNYSIGKRGSGEEKGGLLRFFWDMKNVFKYRRTIGAHF